MWQSVNNMQAYFKRNVHCLVAFVLVFIIELDYEECKLLN